MPAYPELSLTSAGLSDRVFAVLLPRIQAHKGVLHPLHVGDTYVKPPEPAWTEMVRVSDHPNAHNYAPPQGEPGFLDAIQNRLLNRHGVNIPREAIQVTPGATSGINVVIHTLLDPGDEVLLPSPYWPLIRGIIQARGAVPVQIPFFTELERTDFDVEESLERHITSRTKAIYVNTPNNPTGAALNTEHVATLARVAERHNLWVIADEVYEDLYFGDTPPVSVWNNDLLRHRTLVTHSLSKGYGLAGARLGYTHGPVEIMKAIRGVGTFMMYCAARPMQLAGTRALNEGNAWQQALRQSYKEAAQLTSKTLNLPIPAAGTFFFFDAQPYLNGDKDVIPLLEECIDAGVILVPGLASGQDYTQWVRLCFTSVPPDALADALERVKGVLDRRA
jgi:N-succinyldiaminopimelate aminotransferase